MSAERNRRLSRGRWLVFAVGVTCPLWLFTAERFWRFAGFPRLLDHAFAYTLFAAGLTAAIAAVATARTTPIRRVVLSAIALVATGLCYLLMVAISLALIGPINPG